MNEQFYVVVNQVLVFGILMVVGFIMAKVKILTADVLNGLSKLIVKLLLPCLIFHIIVGSGLTIEIILGNKKIAVALLLLYGGLCVLGYLMGSACGLRRSSKDMYALCTMFCNIGFMGVPLIQSIFPDNSEVSVFLLFYTAMDQFLLWSFGVFLCTWHGKGKGGGNPLRNLVNPMMIGIAIALGLLYFEITLPTAVLTTIKGLGDCSRYLALLYLGALLASMPILSMLTRPHVYVLIVLKMTLLPVAVYIGSGFFFSHTIQTVLAVIVSLPPMVANTMMARTYGGDERVAAESVFITTIACLGTIPLVQYLISFF